MNITVAITGDDLSYFEAAARKRGISRTRLAQVIMDAITALKLIDDTLDDEGKSYDSTRATTLRRRADVLSSHKPVLFEKGGSVSSRGQAPTINYRRPVVKTRGELKREFESAAAHTASLDVPPLVASEDIQRMSPDEVRELLASRKGLSLDEIRGLGRTRSSGESV